MGHKMCMRPKVCFEIKEDILKTHMATLTLKKHTP